MDKNNYILSDRTVKDNITIIPNALTKVGLITGYTFTWKQDGYPADYELPLNDDDTGVIAQEVEALGIPGISTTREGLKHVSYKRLIPLLIEAIKELKSEVDELKSKS
tara:strand:- start:90 stop:413 length:324 start_codon:yes stop_codon:yes gene_type:complete